MTQRLAPGILAALLVLSFGAGLRADVAFAEEEAESETPGKPAPAPKTPAAAEGPVFELKDGTRIVGALGQASFQVSTPYGTLTVPAAELVRVRFGTKSDPDLDGRIAGLIKKLGDADFNTREKATTDLEKLGLPAQRALEAASKSGDAEVKERSGRLLETLSNLDEEPPPEDDEVATTRFTIRGTLQCPSFQITTKYGPLTIEKRHILSLTLQERRNLVSLKVAGNRPATREWVETKILLKRGNQLGIKASGTIMLRNWGQQSGPDGNPNCGQHFPNIPVGALVAKIGRNGTLFKVGSAFEGAADRDGPLLLAIGINDQGQQNGGEFKVDISVTEAP